jgi:drug/metabolite transporter (DMT)-like permease
MIKPVLLLFATALLWSAGGILIKIISWHPVAIAGARCTIALPLLTFIYYKQGYFKFSWAQLFGAVCYSMTVILFVVSTKMTTAANAILLQYSAPIYVAIFGIWFLKERVHSLDWIIIVIAMFGILLFFFDKLTFAGFWGNILALITGISFGLLFIFMRMQKDASPLGTIVLGNIFTIILCLPFMVQDIPTSSETWVGLLLLGLFQLGLAYMFLSIAIKKVTALQGIMIPLIEPVLNPIWVLLFYEEVPGIWSVIGGCVVLGAVVIRSLNLLNNYSFRQSPKPVIS